MCFCIKKSSIFANQFANALLQLQLIDNKPFRRAFGSILEGRFPFYKVGFNFFMHQITMN